MAPDEIDLKSWVKDLDQRVRVIEQRDARVDERVKHIDDNVADIKDNVAKELGNISDDFSSLRRDFKGLSDGKWRPVWAIAGMLATVVGLGIVVLHNHTDKPHHAQMGERATAIEKTLETVEKNTKTILDNLTSNIAH
jgi:chaperonin cofactor prefoldin